MVMRHRHDFSRLASARLDAASIDSTSMDSTSIDSTRLDSTPLGMLLRGSCVHAWPCVYVVASSSPLPACLPYVSLPLTICLIGVTHLTPSKSYSSLPSTILFSECARVTLQLAWRISSALLAFSHARFGAYVRGGAAMRLSGSSPNLKPCGMAPP